MSLVCLRRYQICAALIACGAFASGCEPTDPTDLGVVDRLLRSLPTAETLAIEVPGRAPDAAMIAAVESPRTGQPLVPGGTSDIEANAFATRALLDAYLVDTLAAFTFARSARPHTQTETRGVWLDADVTAATEDLIIVERVPTGDVYATVWLRETNAMSPKVWRFLAQATITPSADDPEVMRGTLHVDFGADRKAWTRGDLVLSWSQLEDSRDLSATYFPDVNNPQFEALLTRVIRSRSDAEGGHMAFDAGRIELYHDAAEEQLETLRMVMTWNDVGAFRGDFLATGLDLAEDGYRVLVGSECWDVADRLVTFEDMSALPESSNARVVLRTDGDPTTCAFGQTHTPFLAAAGAIPALPTAPPETDPALVW